MSAPTDQWLARAKQPGKVVRLTDISAEDVDALIDERADLPVVLTYCGPHPRSARTVTEEVIDAMTDIVLRLFPTWLPDGCDTPESDTPGSNSADGDHSHHLDTANAERLARQLSATSHDYGPFVIDMARAAAAGARPHRTRCSAETQVRGLCRLIERSYARVGVVLAVRAEPATDADTQASVADALSWLAQHGPMTVWIPDGVLPQFTRCVTVHGRPGIVHPLGGALTTAAASIPAGLSTDAVLTISRREGMPAPHSAAEQALERALSQQAWAQGRHWNRGVASLDPMAPSIIVDVQWPRAQLVVEVDGDDHRAPIKYANDRARDNMLQRHGHIVLRYTNTQVLFDVQVVVDEIESVLVARTATTPPATTDADDPKET